MYETAVEKNWLKNQYKFNTEPQTSTYNYKLQLCNSTISGVHVASVFSVHVQAP